MVSCFDDEMQSFRLKPALKNSHFAKTYYLFRKSKQNKSLIYETAYKPLIEELVMTDRTGFKVHVEAEELVAVKRTTHPAKTTTLRLGKEH
jgi:hypothetical protein